MKKNSGNEIKVNLYALLNITKDADNDTIVIYFLKIEKSL